MTGRWPSILAALVLLAAALAVGGAARAQNAPVIEEVRIEGAQRIEPATVQSYMLVRPGDPYDQQRIDRSLKNLFGTGLFADVTITRQGDVLVVKVVENPIINRVAFEGNNRVEDKVLESEIQLRPRTVYTRTRVQSDVKRILDVYRRSGRFAATVEPAVIKRPQNRVDLVFEIDEGPLTGIKTITFIGNREFSDSKLRGVIQTTESAWYKVFSTDDSYDPDRLTFDQELLRRFYLSEGYADFRVLSSVAELAPEGDGFFITFTLEEGQRYKFGEVEVVSEIDDLAPERLMSLVKFAPGDWYDADLVEETIEELTEAAGNLGYAFVEIRPRVRRDRETATIDIVFEIQEGPRVYVERINITGNTRTLDKVIRREFRLVEGDAFNAVRLRRSEQRIRNLGFFEKVEVTNVPGDQPDKTVIDVEVQEKSTGEINIGAGFSTESGALGDLTIRERNLLGRGQDLKLGLRLAQKSSSVDLSFTHPYFLDRPLTAGIDLFFTTVDRQDQSSYSARNLGGSLRMGYNINEHLRQNWRYVLNRQTIADVPDTAAREIRDQEGTFLTSAVTTGLIYDRTDNRFSPTEGYFLEGNAAFAGLGGDVRYGSGEVSGGYYMQPLEDVVASITGEAGIIQGWGGKDVRIGDRFFLGGTSLRGFEVGGIGPRDVETDDSLGGNNFWAGTVEMTFPLGLPEELGFRGAVFSDFGSLWAVDAPAEDPIYDSAAPRAAVGAGIAWRSPFGPVRVDLAQAVLKEDFDKTQLFTLSFGTRF